MRAVRVRATFEALESAMRLPETAHIVDVARVDVNMRTVELVIEHPSFNDCAELPEATVVITKHQERLSWIIGGADVGDSR